METLPGMPAASKSSTEAGERPTNRWPYPRKRRSAAVEDVTAGGSGEPSGTLNCCGLASDASETLEFRR